MEEVTLNERVLLAIIWLVTMGSHTPKLVDPDSERVKDAVVLSFVGCRCWSSVTEPCPIIVPNSERRVRSLTVRMSSFATPCKDASTVSVALSLRIEV